jgi:RNA polymerase-interacting CarD/CdnL/TRCF family regulator
MKKVNFNEIEIENIDGSVAKLNIRKDFANALYSQGKTLDVVELARKIWHSENETELTDEELKIVEENAKQFYPSYIVHNAVINSIK